LEQVVVILTLLAVGVRAAALALLDVILAFLTRAARARTVAWPIALFTRVASSGAPLVFLGLTTEQKIFFVVEPVHAVDLDFVGATRN